MLAGSAGPELEPGDQYQNEPLATRLGRPRATKPKTGLGDAGNAYMQHLRSLTPPTLLALAALLLQPGCGERFGTEDARTSVGSTVNGPPETAGEPSSSEPSATSEDDSELVNVIDGTATGADVPSVDEPTDAGRPDGAPTAASSTDGAPTAPAGDEPPTADPAGQTPTEPGVDADAAAPADVVDAGPGETPGAGGSSSDPASGTDACTSNCEADAGSPTPIDECPDWPEQTKKGSCGCGFEPDPSCEVLELALRHRYSFGDDGNVAVDSIGGADGEVVGTELDGSGQLELSGTGDYVELPAGIISALGDATFETWVDWHGGAYDQRVFAFGATMSGGFVGPTAQSYIFVSPSAPTGGFPSTAPLTASYSLYGQTSASFLRASGPLPTNRSVHLALVVDDAGNEIRLYLDGDLAGETPLAWSLSQLNDRINRLGRSLVGDDDLDATFDEFRIYDAALTKEELNKSIELGPDTTFSR